GGQQRAAEEGPDPGELERDAGLTPVLGRAAQRLGGGVEPAGAERHGAGGPGRQAADHGAAVPAGDVGELGGGALGGREVLVRQGDLRLGGQEVRARDQVGGLGSPAGRGQGGAYHGGGLEGLALGQGEERQARLAGVPVGDRAPE